MATEFIARNGLIVISGQIQGLLASGIVLSGSIASGQVSNFKLSSGAAIYNLQSGNIVSGLLANNSVVSGSIASGQIGQMHLSSGSINSGQLATLFAFAGYFAGGFTTGTEVATADKLTYSTDVTIAQTTANLSQARLGLAGCSGEGTKGYFAGGMTGLANVTVTTADKITYSNDTTTAQTTGNLSQARYYLTGCSGENTKGYFAGGISSNLGLGVVTSDKITYTSDTTAAQTSANLSQARGYLAGVTEGSQKGYFAGGNSSGNQVTAEKLKKSALKLTVTVEVEKVKIAYEAVLEEKVKALFELWNKK